MNLENDFTLVFTRPEIEWVLLQLNAPNQRLYVSPFKDRAPEYVEDALEEARVSLIKRGLVLEQPNTALALDVTCAGMIGVLGFSEEVLRLDIFRERDTKPQTYYYFNAEDLVVERSSADDDKITLTALRDLNTLRARLCEHLGLKNQQAPRGGTCKCTEEAFAAIPYTLAGDGKPAAIAQLVRLGADERFASDLLCAMASPLQQATLQVVHLDPEQPEGVRVTDKLNLIEGIYGLWVLVTRFEEKTPTIEIIPCDAAQAKKYIDELLEGFVA